MKNASYKSAAGVMAGLIAASLFVGVVLAADHGYERAALNHPTGTRGLFLVDKLGGKLHFFDPKTLKEESSWMWKPIRMTSFFPRTTARYT